MKLNRNKLAAFVVLGLFVGCGLYVYTNAHAATPSVSVESETGARSGSICNVPDVSASAGNAVQFGCGNSSTGMLARRAADYQDSVGVVAHLGASRYANAAEVKSDLAFLGISHVRTNVIKNGNLATRRDLAASGIQFNYTIAPPQTGIPSQTQIQTDIDNRISDVVGNNLQSSTDSLEPYNEYDGASNNGNANWAAILQSFQPYIFDQMRLQLPLAKVLGPALIGNSLATDSSLLGDLTAKIDYGNLHSYYGGRQPESRYPDATPETANFMSAAACSSLTNDIDFDHRLELLATCTSKSKPIVMTEMGYHNDPTSTTHKYTSPQAVGVYMPRAFLEMFRIGLVRTYSYELLDEPTVSPSFEQHFGYFDDTGAAKPSATAMHNLFTVLQDTGPNKSTFTPSRLEYTLGGSTTDLHKVLLQKSDGSFWLALWQATSVFDYPTGKDLGPAAFTPKPVTLTLPTFRTASVFADNSLTETALGTNTSFNLSIGPKVSIVRISQ